MPAEVKAVSFDTLMKIIVLQIDPSEARKAELLAKEQGTYSGEYLESQASFIALFHEIYGHMTNEPGEFLSDIDNFISKVVDYLSDEHDSIMPSAWVLKGLDNKHKFIKELTAKGFKIAFEVDTAGLPSDATVH